MRLLDLGTGTGCLLIALLTELENAVGLGIDISEDAMAVASRNAGRHGVDHRAEFRQGNWGDGLDGSFDLILSNPPYVYDTEDLPPDVREYEPLRALFGGPDGLDPLRAMVGDVKRLLTLEGSYVMEYGQGQAEGVCKILKDEGFEIIRIGRDLAGIERAVVAKVAKSKFSPRFG